MLEAKNIYKNFNEVQVLKGVDISVSKGEIVSIIGESGAGKSTLLQILGTLDKPNLENSTSILINNVNILHLNQKELSDFRNQHIGFIFQFHQLLPEFTALENTMLPGMIAGKNKNELLKRAKNLLDFLNLSHRFEHKPSQLSGGEQQRIAVARALFNQPNLIFADEPSGNLDSKNAEELHHLFFKLRNEFNQTFVIVTHNQELAKMSDRCLAMKDGKFI
jgi:lipoprotein-releasing system ATP-binding protein